MPRERLFSRLDALLGNPVTWIWGPPGAGKTTLVASYLDVRGTSGLWYQVDAGDRDLSTFFFYLGEAAKRIAPDKRPLPLLTPEYLPDPVGFARRWFREFFPRLAVPSVLVLDNYQEASELGLDSIISAAIPDIPQGVRVLVVSRTSPPPVFARPLANKEVAVLGWDELRLTMEEATALAEAKGVSAVDTVAAVLEQCEGWAAGLTLMLERVRDTGCAAQVQDLDSMETIFAYFAGLVFDALPNAAQRLLVLSSYLPSVSQAQAKALTGGIEAGQLLEQFYRRHLFTNRRRDPEPVYEFHALFRAFLRARTPHVLSPDRQRRAVMDSAGLLLESGQGSAALMLLAEIEDWQSIERAIQDRAAALLAQGRGQTLREWIALLPPQRVHDSAWIQYWHGTALVASDQQRARAILTRAYEQFHAADDFDGQIAAASGVVDTYFFSFSGYAGLREWTEKLAHLLEQEERFSSPEQRLQACCGYLLAAFFGDGRHPQTDRYAAEIRRLIREPLEPSLRLRAGTILVSYAGAIQHPAMVRDDLELLDGFAGDAGVAPLRQAQWQHRYAFLSYQLGDFELALSRVAIGIRLCSEHGLRSPLSLLNQLAVFVSVAGSDAHAAVETLQRWEQILSPDRPVERSQWNIARLMTLLLREDRKGEWPALAREIAEQMDATGQTWIRIANRIPGAYALIESGEYETVRRWIATLRSLLADTCFARYERDVLLVEADLAIHEGQDNLARDRLGRALRLTAAAQIPLQCAHSPRAFQRLLRFACREGIETDTARAIAARYRLPLEADHDQATLQTLQVFTLGGFDLSRNGRPVKFKGKPQQRPLGLLKVLAACGARGASMSSLAEALWPDSEGDRATNALKVTLHRLRGLLGRDEAITVRHGTLILDPHYCWTDVRAFEDLAERAERHRVASEFESFESAADSALALYKGTLLPAEEPAPWLLAARERLAHRARTLILALGMHLESSGRAALACTVYESGLTIDSLSESLYQRLMRAHLSAGQNAEAMQVYRRCREILSIVLGIPPAAETQALFRRAQAADHP